MGTWDGAIWANDTAADWAYQLEEAEFEDGVSLISDVFENIDVDDAELRAANDTLAVLLGKPAAEEGGVAHEWAAEHRALHSLDDSVAEELLEHIERHLIAVLCEELEIEIEELEDDEASVDALWDDDAELSDRAQELKWVYDALSA